MDSTGSVAMLVRVICLFVKFLGSFVVATALFSLIGLVTVIRSDQNHLERHSERGTKTRQTEEEVGRQH